MARYKPERRNSKTIWRYLMDWIYGSILFCSFIAIVKILGYEWIIYNYEVLAYLIVVSLFSIAAQIWRRLFFGTVNGKIVIEKSKVLSDEVQNIEISLRANDYKAKVDPVSKNAKGEYLFQCKIPVGHKFTLGVDVDNNRVVTEDIGEIEGVRWLFGRPNFELPISAGQPKQVDLVIPNIPQDTIATHRFARTSYSYHNVPWVILGTAMIIFTFWGAPAEILGRFLPGTIYGQVTREDGDTMRLENIEVSLHFSKMAKKWKPVLTNSKGEYRFDKCIPGNLKYIAITVKYGSGAPGHYREITKIIDGFEGVRKFLGLPISSGIPKRVDFVIPDIPPPIIGN